MREIKFTSPIGHAADTASGRYGLSGVLVAAEFAAATDGRIAAIADVKTTGEEGLPVFVPAEIAPKSQADVKRATYGTNGSVSRVTRQRVGKPVECAGGDGPNGRFPKLEQCLPEFGPLDVQCVLKIDPEKLLAVAKAISDPSTGSNAVYLLIPQGEEKQIHKAIGVVPGEVSRGKTNGLGVIMPVPINGRDAGQAQEHYQRVHRDRMQKLGDAIAAWNAAAAKENSDNAKEVVSA